MERINNLKKLGNLLLELEGKSKATSEQLVLLFNLHNYFNPRKPEYSKHCSPCVARVYKKCKAIYQELKTELSNENL